MALKTKASKTGAPVFVDSSAFIAFLDSSDTYFPVFSRAFANPPHLLTSSLVIAECHGWFMRRYDCHRARQFLEFIKELPRLSVLAVGGEDLNAARDILDEFDDQKLTLADAFGLHVLRTRRLKICWSTDRHLSLTGAQLLINISRK